MPNLPKELLARLSPEESAALDLALKMVLEELRGVYKRNVDQYVEADGDNAKVFGIRVGEHLRFRLGQRCEEDPLIYLEELRWSYRLRVGPLGFRINKLGDSVNDDIYSAVPAAPVEPEQQADPLFVQESLFALVPDPPLPTAEAALLNDLVIGHFGNPRDGLVKCYAGAVVLDELERRRWAWVERQEAAEGGTERESRRPAIVPFDQRQPAELEVGAKAAQTEKAGEPHGQG